MYQEETFANCLSFFIVFFCLENTCDVTLCNFSKHGLTSMECFFSDSVYVAASNVVKSRVSADDLFIYKVNDSSVALSPPAERKLEPCEIIGLIMLIFKGNTLIPTPDS